MKLLSSLYKSMQKKELGERAGRVGEAYHSLFTNFAGSYQITAFWDRFVPKSEKPRDVLIVGTFGGRDYYYFSLQSDTVSVMDLREYPEFARSRQGDIQKDRPFDRESFDIIVLAEVVEHLLYDYDALMNIRSMLREGGTLLMTVPYYNDQEPTHIRVHSRASITRLLAAAGFEIVDYGERPGLLRLGRTYMALVHLVNFLYYLVARGTCYRALFRITSVVDMALSRHWMPWRSLSVQYGASLKCQKTTARSVYRDFVEFNRDSFRSRVADP